MNLAREPTVSETDEGPLRLQLLTEVSPADLVRQLIEHCAILEHEINKCANCQHKPQGSKQKSGSPFGVYETTMCLRQRPSKFPFYLKPVSANCR